MHTSIDWMIRNCASQRCCNDNELQMAVDEGVAAVRHGLLVGVARLGLNDGGYGQRIYA